MVCRPWDCINKCVLVCLREVIKDEDECNGSVEGRV